ncbi:sulfatase-like hydrolase/transferase [Flavitalea antarctica]
MLFWRVPVLFFMDLYLRLFVQRLLLVLLCVVIAGNVFCQQPNIIYIMADDMGYADLSCFGRKDYQTPNFDKLASEGMIFKNAYAAAAVCTPTRAAFMTGRYPARTEIGLLEPWIPSPRDEEIGLSESDFSIAAAMKKAGYETALIGKWHLGRGTRFTPAKNGFDYFYGIKTGAADYFSHKGDAGRIDMYENENLIEPTGYMTDLLAAKAIAFLDTPHAKPFFLSLQFTAPHWPWQGPTDKALNDSLFQLPRGMMSNGSPAIYAAMMKSLDDQIGNIMATLKSKGLEKNTVIIFTSDNGGEKFSDMGPYSKGKMSAWEGGVRVPAFVKWPGKIKPGTSARQPVITMDWTATILAIAGAKGDSRLPPDGINLIPVFENSKLETARTFYWRLTQRTNQHAILEGNWKYLNDAGKEYLFNIAEDPGEKVNLSQTNPGKLSNLKEKYLAWQNSILVPLPLINR